MRRGGRPGLVAAVLLLAPVAAGPVSAQAPAVAAGRVLLPGRADTVPLPRARVLLHRVGRDAQGPIDSVLTDAAGTFRFRFRADTGALYLLSARHGGIEYFSPPVHAGAGRPDTGVRLVVYDTSSTAPVTVDARHLVVSRASQDGSRPVLDLIVLGNAGLLARVAPDSAHPSWSIALPPGTVGLEVGESDLSPDAVVRVGDSVRVLAPLAPGQKQLSLQYVLPAGARDVRWPVGAGGAPVNLLVEDADVRVSGGTLAPADSQVIEGRRFRRYAGQVPPGGVIRLQVGGAAPATWPVLAGLVAAVASVFGLAAWRFLRRPRALPAATDDAAGLLDALAALDARFGGREADTPAAEWRAYQVERARLKAALERALAGAAVSR